MWDYGLFRTWFFGCLCSPSLDTAREQQFWRSNARHCSLRIEPPITRSRPKTKSTILTISEVSVNNDFSPSSLYISQICMGRKIEHAEKTWMIWVLDCWKTMMWWFGLFWAGEVPLCSTCINTTCESDLWSNHDKPIFNVIHWYLFLVSSVRTN